MPAGRLDVGEPVEQDRGSACVGSSSAPPPRVGTRPYSTYTEELDCPVLCSASAIAVAADDDDDRQSTPQATGDRRGAPPRRSCATATCGTSMDEIAAARRRLEADRLQALRRQGAPLLRDRRRHRQRGERPRPRRGASSCEDSGDLEADLRDLARRQLALVMQPRLMQLRRLVIAEAARFPELGRTFYEQGPGRTIAALAATFERLAARGLLDVDDPTSPRRSSTGWSCRRRSTRRCCSARRRPDRRADARPLRRRRRAHLPRRLRPTRRRDEEGARQTLTIGRGVARDRRRPSLQSKPVPSGEAACRRSCRRRLRRSPGRAARRVGGVRRPRLP